MMTMSVVTSVNTVGSKKLPPCAARLPPVTTLAHCWPRRRRDAGSSFGQFLTSARSLVAAIVGAPLNVKRTADDCAGISGYHAELVTCIDYPH